MKIGILSINLYPRALNFACPIHSFSFQRFLKNNGIESTIIDYMASYDFDFDFRHPFNTYKKKYEALLKKNGNISNDETRLSTIKQSMDDYSNIYYEREGRYDKFKSFTDKYYKKTAQTYNSDLMETMDLDFDCYICATDVIWKTCNIKKWGLERAFFLASHSMDNKHKIAYAASRNSELQESEYPLFFHYLDDFDSISVREEDLKTLIESNSTIDVQCVLDPVMLLPKQDYINIAIIPTQDNYLLLYYVVKDAEDTILQAISYAKHHKLKIIELSDKPYSSLHKMGITDVDYTWMYDIGPEEWLGYILNASCIFTNSFHACCFSLLFEKEFFVGARNGYKVQNFLRSFNLTERQFDIDHDLIHTPLSPIDYDMVNIILGEKRTKSANYILNAIHDAEHNTRMPYDYDSYRKKLTYELVYKCFIHEKNINEYVFRGMVINNHSHCLINPFVVHDGHTIIGWKIKVLIDNIWFWYLENGTFIDIKIYDKLKHPRIKIFSFGENMPYFPFNKITKAVAEGVWKNY